MHQVPGAMVAGPTGRASVIEFEEGHAHVSVGFALGAAPCFLTPSLAVLRDELVPLDAVCGDAGAFLRERLLEAPGPENALTLMEDFLIGQMADDARPDPAVVAAAGALARGSRVAEVADRLGLLPGPCGGGSRCRWALRRRGSAGCSGFIGWSAGSTDSPSGLGRHGRPARLLRPGASRRRVP